MKLDYEEAMELFTYDSETGAVEWKKKRSKKLLTNVVGSLTPQGYLNIRIKHRTYKVHRIAWLLYYGEWPEGQIDHINWVKSDNRISNLRDVTQSINQRNRRLSKMNTSGITGVHFNKANSKWWAYLAIDGKYTSLGYYHDKDEAVAARRAAERENGYL